MSFLAEELLAPLDNFVAQHWPEGLVRVVRKKERQGLIRARLEGAKEAVGDVVIFLDCHCEATEGWLEPMLARIKEDRKAVLCPTIGAISNSVRFCVRPRDNFDFYDISL